MKYGLELARKRLYRDFEILDNDDADKFVLIYRLVETNTKVGNHPNDGFILSTGCKNMADDITRIAVNHATRQPVLAGRDRGRLHLSNRRLGLPP